MFKQISTIPGEHTFQYEGKVGLLEGILTVPEQSNEQIVAILGHPHSLHGGTMQNKVVTTMSRAFKAKGIPNIRFNFRGVGASEGKYDAGIGESQDMLILIDLWQKEMASNKIIFAGFSFGSYVAYRAAAQHPHALLISIAPAVDHYDYQEFQPPTPCVIFQGEEDEVVSAQLVYDFADNQKPPLSVVRFPETSHFFHGKLLNLREKLEDLVSSI